MITVLSFFLPVPNEINFAIPVVSVALAVGINVYAWQQRRHRPEQKFDIRRLVQARTKVSFLRGSRTRVAPPWLSGSIVFVWEFGNRSEVLVRLDTPVWDSQIRWDFIALVPLAGGERFVILMRDGQMDVHVYLAGQRELDRLRRKLRGLRRPKGPPILRVGQGRVSLVGRGS